MKLNIAWKCTCHILLKYSRGKFIIIYIYISIFQSSFLKLILGDTHRHPVKVVPILVGALSAENEALYGQLLAKYVDDPNNFFSVSSDFCHWGSRYVLFTSLLTYLLL